MLINSEKTTIEVNEPLENYYFIDESTEEGQSLAQKIRANYPYFDFVLDDKGELIDITPIEKPETEPEIPVPTLEDRLEIAENTILGLMEIIMMGGM